MKKQALLKELADEISRHDLSTFADPKDGVVAPGCSSCKKPFGTVEQFKRHLCEDVLPVLLDRLSTEGKQ